MTKTLDERAFMALVDVAMEAAVFEQQVGKLADAGRKGEARNDVRAALRELIADAERKQAALLLLKRIRYHAERRALPRDWLTAADEVLGTWGPPKFDHPEIEAARADAAIDAARKG